MALFEGLSAFPITPLDSHGEIDAKGLGEILERLVAAKVDSIGLLGSTGSYMYLSGAQRRRVLKIAVEVLAGRVPLMVGIGAMTTQEALSLGKDAKAAGADAVLLAPVSYLPLAEDEVFEHFRAVSAATDLPLCIYNNPVATHFTFSRDLLARLSHLDAIGGVKMPAPAPEEVAGELAAMRPKMPADFKIGYSRDPRGAQAVLNGGDAWYSGIAGMLPEAVMRLHRGAAEGNAADVARLNAAFEPLWNLVNQHGTVRVVYAIASLRGIFRGDPPRPVLPLPGTERDTLEIALHRLEAV